MSREQELDIFKILRKLLPMEPPYLPIPRFLVEGFEDPVIDMIDSELKAIKEAKKAEWERKGYKPGIIDLALKLAEEYAWNYSGWIAEIAKEPELRTRMFKAFYQYALEHVAEPWIKIMGK